MNQNYDFISTGKYDVGSIRNFLLDEIRNKNRTAHTQAFHTVYALMLAVLIFLGTAGQALNLNSGIILLCQFTSPAMCVFTFIYSSTFLKALSVGLPLAAAATVVVPSLTQLTPFSVSPFVLSYIQILLAAIVLTKTTLSGYSKTVCFVITSVCYGFITLCGFAVAIMAVYGELNTQIFAKAIDDFFLGVCSSAIENLDAMYSTDYLKNLFGYSENITKEAILLDIKNMLLNSFEAIKAFLPAIFALSCMLYSFITVGIFSAFAKKQNLNVFVCIMDSHWTYRLSMVSIRIYDILFIVFIISMFVSLPVSVGAAVINLFIILTPLMLIAGIKSIYAFLFAKFKTKTTSVLLTLLICFLASAILGPYSIFLIGSVGTAFLANRDRAEKLLMPVKILQDKAALEAMNNPEKSQSQAQDTQTTDI